MRIALIEPSHWHYEMYRPGLEAAGVEIVSVADSIDVIGQSIASDWGCRSWTDYRVMVDEVKPDFVFAFGQHSKMPAIAFSLLERGIPFSIEKPCGTSSKDVQGVAETAGQANAFVSVPFHYRLSSMRSSLETVTPLPSSGFERVRFRIIAGSPLRFLDSSPWLVDPVAAGGGCMMNLAHHAIDFLLSITGSAVVEVEASTSNSALGLPVEDTATMVLRMQDGSVGVIETGYTHPADADSYMEFGFEAQHRSFLALNDETGLCVTRLLEPKFEHVPTNWRFKDYFAAYAVDTLRRYQAGERPLASLSDLQATMDVVEAAYKSARLGRPISVCHLSGKLEQSKPLL
ncbi:putative dehydrogenase [Paraburkholderia sp. BL27I4N3]|uniref:Gfo/Idh/MocA family protein n=1 Tax=Paraburkholderia sp. BL27I4N3 TaxID=1938805 RepID=UPI000E2759FB|nr:Gfo/Idh/MocA family oxidoreductase [Paraburkholderia sp. BL27I4N3]REE17729.1 putative dehydrogenase [Paraburkholderia sp. BL27I4N3]